jgi:hypothetical protein
MTDTTTPWYSNLKFPLYENDQINDCVLAAACNWIIVQSRGGNTPEDSDALNAYAYLTGFQGGQGTGTMELPFLRYWQNTGIGGIKLDHWEQKIKISDHEAISDKIKTKLCLYADVYLPLNGGSDDIWSGKSGKRLHAIILIDTDNDGVFFVTWGGIKKMTWKYFDENITAIFDFFVNQGLV